jgi:ubiquinone/menaquinone biosynthesis C-methylase UbiE
MDTPGGGVSGSQKTTFQSEEDRIRAAGSKLHADPRHSWFNPGFSFMLQDRERHFLDLLRQQGYEDLRNKRILEVGCSVGAVLRDFLKWGARPENLFGVDLGLTRLVEARALCPTGVTLECANASRLAFRADRFDLVLQSTMFTSILDDQMRRDAASEMVRVVKPDGFIIWYDFHMNNPRNPDVRRVTRREIHALFSGCAVKLRRMTLAPPLARGIAPISRLACDTLAKIPWLCTHYLGTIRKA